MNKLKIHFYKPLFLLLFLQISVVYAQQIDVNVEVAQVIQKALENNKELKIKANENSKTLLSAEEVNAKRLPHVSALGGYGYIHGNGNLDIPTLTLPITQANLFAGSTPFTVSTQVGLAGINVNQIIFSGLQITNAKKALNEKYTAQQFLLEAAKEDLVKEIMTSFDQIMLLKEVDVLILDTEKRLKKEQERVSKAIANGVAIPYDRDKIKLAVLELEEKKIELQGNRTLLYQRISQLSGVPVEVLQSIDYPLSPFTLDISELNIENRAELKALQAGDKALQYQYKQQQGSHLPAVFAFGSANYLNVFDSKVRVKDVPLINDLNLRTNKLELAPNLMIGVGVKWTIFSGGEHKTKLKQIQLDQQINQEKRLDTEEKLNLLLLKNQTLYRSSSEKLKVGLQQLQIANNNLNLASKQFEAGLIDVTERLKAENDYYKIQLNYKSLILQQREVSLTLVHTTGHLLNTTLK